MLVTGRQNGSNPILVCSSCLLSSPSRRQFWVLRQLWFICRVVHFWKGICGEERYLFVLAYVCFCLILRLLQLASISDRVPSAACLSPELCTHSPQTSGTSLISVCMAYSPLHGNSFRYPYQRKEMAPISRFFTAKQVIAISLTVKYLWMWLFPVVF